MKIEIFICLTYTNKQTEKLIVKLENMYSIIIMIDLWLMISILIIIIIQKNGISYYTSQKALIKDINKKISFPYKILKSEEYCLYKIILKL